MHCWAVPRQAVRNERSQIYIFGEKLLRCTKPVRYSVQHGSVLASMRWTLLD